MQRVLTAAFLEVTWGKELNAWWGNVFSEAAARGKLRTSTPLTQGSNGKRR